MLKGQALLKAGIRDVIDQEGGLRKLKRQFDESQQVEFFCQPVNFEIPLDILVE